MSDINHRRDGKLHHVDAFYHPSLSKCKRMVSKQDRRQLKAGLYIAVTIDEETSMPRPNRENPSKNWHISGTKSRDGRKRKERRERRAHIAQARRLEKYWNMQYSMQG